MPWSALTIQVLLIQGADNFDPRCGRFRSKEQTVSIQGADNFDPRSRLFRSPSTTSRPPPVAHRPCSGIDVHPGKH
eukprot:358082-Chlamydomonas_euryale.AAC.3